MCESNIIFHFSLLSGESLGILRWRAPSPSSVSNLHLSFTGWVIRFLWTPFYFYLFFFLKKTRLYYLTAVKIMHQISNLFAHKKNIKINMICYTFEWHFNGHFEQLKMQNCCMHITTTSCHQHNLLDATWTWKNQKSQLIQLFK